MRGRAPVGRTLALAGRLEGSFCWGQGSGWTSGVRKELLTPGLFCPHQRQERFAERPALLELERFVSWAAAGGPTVSQTYPAPCHYLALNLPHALQERRALERKAAELEEELKVTGACDGQ